MSLRSLLALSLAAGLSAISLSASSLGTASDFNVFVFGSYQQNYGIVEGRVAVDGNAKYNNVSVATGLAANASRNDLIVNGNLKWNNGLFGQSGSNYGIVSGTKQVAIGGSSHISAGTPAGIDFASVQNDLLTSATAWSGLAANGTVDPVWSSSFNLTGTDSTLNVFNFNAGNFSLVNGALNLIAPEASTVLINIFGTDATLLNFAFNYTGVAADRVLLNFVDATSITINNGDFLGTILAPLADVRFNNGQMHGSLIAGSLQANSVYYRDLGFTGNIDPAAVPEPSSMALFGIGVAALGIWRRRAVAGKKQGC